MIKTNDSAFLHRYHRRKERRVQSFHERPKGRASAPGLMFFSADNLPGYTRLYTDVISRAHYNLFFSVIGLDNTIDGHYIPFLE